MAIKDFLEKKEKEAQLKKIKEDAEAAHRVRMQSLETLPSWVIAAREEEAEKKKTGEAASGGSVEGGSGGTK